jgi:hypothetical protein
MISLIKVNNDSFGDILSTQVMIETDRLFNTFSTESGSEFIRNVGF